jgi:glycosyltransferase involved in cell wall biosynthesis
MRIAIVHEKWGAGAARCARDLEAGLGRNHKVIFFPRNDQEGVRSVMEGLDEFQPDVVNCHSFYGCMPYATLARISTRYPTCFTVHDPRPVGTMETVCWSCHENTWCLRCPLIKNDLRRVVANRFFLSRLRKRWTHNRCGSDMVLACPSLWMAQRLREQELSRFRSIHIPDGIDLERFKPLPASRARFGLPEQGTVLLHLAWRSGQWTVNDRKGMRFLGEAFISHIVPKYPDTYLAVAGESFAPNHPNVRALGVVDQKDLPALLASVDVFVTPTLADNFPYTVLESMACAKAVVASAVGGIPEQVEEGRTGFLVPAGDAVGIGQAVARLLEEPGLVRKFGDAGRAKVEKEFAMPQFLNSYESLFEELIESRRRRSKR